MCDLDFSRDNPYEVQSFTKNGITFYSLFDFGDIESEYAQHRYEGSSFQTMQRNGVFYHVARLPQEMIGGYYLATHTKAELKEMFGDFPDIYLTESGVNELIQLMKEQPKGEIACEGKGLLAA